MTPTPTPGAVLEIGQAFSPVNGSIVPFRALVNGTFEHVVGHLPGGVAAHAARQIPEDDLEVFQPDLLGRVGVDSTSGIGLAVGREVIFEDKRRDRRCPLRVRFYIDRNGPAECTRPGSVVLHTGAMGVPPIVCPHVEPLVDVSPVGSVCPAGRCATARDCRVLGISIIEWGRGVPRQDGEVVENRLPIGVRGRQIHLAR